MLRVCLSWNHLVQCLFNYYCWQRLLAGPGPRGHIRQRRLFSLQQRSREKRIFCGGGVLCCNTNNILVWTLYDKSIDFAPFPPLILMGWTMIDLAKEIGNRQNNWPWHAWSETQMMSSKLCWAAWLAQVELHDVTLVQVWPSSLYYIVRG